MKRLWLLIILLPILLAHSSMAFELTNNVKITISNEEYLMNNTMSFSSMELSTNHLLFNDVGWFITAPSPITITLMDLMANPDSAGHEDTVIRYKANTETGMVTFTFTDLENDARYYVKRDGVTVNDTVANPYGTLTFKSNDWTEHTFIIEHYEPIPPVESSVSDLNGTTLINDPFGVIFSPWTSIFEEALGKDMGEVFWLFLLVIMSFAIYIKTETPEVTMLFMIGSGAFFSTSTAFNGVADVTMAFIIFTGIGITALFIKFVYFRGE